MASIRTKPPASFGRSRAPTLVYPSEGWKGYGDWLGTDAVATRLKKYRPFEDARRFVRSLGLQSNAEWQSFIKRRTLPSDIPTNPHRTYAGDGWCSLGDWLGNGEIAPRFRQYRPFSAAREFVRKLGLRTQKEWQSYARSDERPADIPTNPDKTYAGVGWQGYGDWLCPRREAGATLMARDHASTRKRAPISQ